MIRLLIVALGVFLLWVLFVSDYNKKRKIIISIITVVIAIVGIWLEQKEDIIRSGLIDATQIVDCGVTVKHSYRTNYDVRFCLQNNSSDAVAKRAELEFSALRCDDNGCEPLQVINKSVRLNLLPGTTQNLVENLNFSDINPEQEGVVWKVVPISVLAKR